MAKQSKKKTKKHVFKVDDLPQDYDFSLIGIQTQKQLYQLVFDFNRIFLTGFFLNKDIEVIRKSKKIAFENYVTEENNIGQKMYLLNNEVLIPIAHPNTLFDTHEAYYLFPELQSLTYLLMMPNHSGLDLETIKQKFIVSYPIHWIKVDLRKCATAFPVFPG